MLFVMMSKYVLENNEWVYKNDGFRSKYPNTYNSFKVVRKEDFNTQTVVKILKTYCRRI